MAFWYKLLIPHDVLSVSASPNQDESVKLLSNGGFWLCLIMFCVIWEGGRAGVDCALPPALPDLLSSFMSVEPVFSRVLGFWSLLCIPLNQASVTHTCSCLPTGVSHIVFMAFTLPVLFFTRILAFKPHTHLSGTQRQG